MSEKKILPVSAIIPTKDRTEVLLRTLNSLAGQSYLPEEIILVDASSTNEAEQRIPTVHFPPAVHVVYAKAIVKGAAQQRMQAMQLATTNVIFFMDDDILFEERCVEQLFRGFEQTPKVGGVNAMITNQRYKTPGLITRVMLIILSGKRLGTWAGKVVGPAWNLLPEDNPEFPEYVECEWLNSGCTMYRREALPNPVFPERFKGYSIMEDLAVSLKVGKSWTLLNARTARIFHDSQPGDYKSSLVRISEMEVMNRHYVMTQVLGRNKFRNYAQLFLFEMFKLSTLLTSPSKVRILPRVMIGKIKGYFNIIFS
jgi:GT2 family glycosyltransferase